MGRKKKEQKVMVFKIEGYVQVPYENDDYDYLEVGETIEDTIQGEIKDQFAGVGHGDSTFEGTIELQKGKKIITETIVTVVDDDSLNTADYYKS